jgi:signal transduction histidine kinase
VSRVDRLLNATSSRLASVPKDAALAVCVGALQLAVTFTFAHGQENREPMDLLAVALLLGAAAPLAFRSRAPLAVLIATMALAVVYWTLDYPRGPVFLAAIIAFVCAVIVGRRVAAWTVLALGSTAIVYMPSVVGEQATPTFSKVVGLAVWIFLLAAAAEVIRAKSEHHVEEERARRQQDLAIAGQERLRIARELHDLLAHNVSLINVQAGTALHLLDEQPERARPALEAIKEASSETLREMRSVLSVLRRPGEQPPRSPTAGIAGIGELAERTTAAGIPVATEVAGEPRPVPVSVDLAVYRIVQEALTNVARHARPSGAVVRLSYSASAVTVEIDDEGAEARAVNGTGGNGIAGMRERAAALGGEFSAGPRPGAGFRVRATLPLAERRCR